VVIAANAQQILRSRGREALSEALRVLALPPEVGTVLSVRVRSFLR
jgi:hypothetical protein